MDEQKIIEVVGPAGRIVIEKKDLPRHRAIGYVTAEEYKKAVDSSGSDPVISSIEESEE